MKKQTSVFENSLIWFGAGVSIAEILTGTYFAPLGFEKGILAVIIGHISDVQCSFVRDSSAVSAVKAQWKP